MEGFEQSQRAEAKVKELLKAVNTKKKSVNFYYILYLPC